MFESLEQDMIVKAFGTAPRITQQLQTRLRQTYRQAREEIRSYSASIVGRMRVRRHFNRNTETRLEIGATRDSAKPGFITTDLQLRAHYPCDLRLGLPFPSGVFDLIYAEHVLEHFHQPELLFILSECYRTLKPGGILSVSVPDAMRYVNAYVSPVRVDPDLWCRYKYNLRQLTPIDLLNYIFYMDGQHRYMFDERSLVLMLAYTGFHQARLRDYDAGLDQQSRRHESLYAEAVRPRETDAD
jgi:predicted SAM-dependent methyltransferase